MRGAVTIQGSVQVTWQQLLEALERYVEHTPTRNLAGLDAARLAAAARAIRIRLQEELERGQE